MSVLDIPQEVRDEIKLVREEKNGYVVIGYEGKTKLRVVSSGEGGFPELCNALIDNEFCYGLYRTSLQIDSSLTTKFVFVHWAPDAAAPTVKALLGTHIGKVSNELFQPFHVDLKASDRSDLDEKQIISKLESAAGVRQNVLSEKEALTRKKFTSVASTSASSSQLDKGNAPSSGAEVAFVDEEIIREAIEDVRNDSTETSWALISYEGVKKLKFSGKGTGEVEGLVQAIDEKVVNYGIFRTTEKIDNSVTVKFVFVHYQPESIPLFQRATLTTHKGLVEALFSPYHTSFHITLKSELSDEIVKTHLSQLSGKGEAAEQRLQKTSTWTKKETQSSPAGPGTTKGVSGASLAVLDKNEIDEAIKSVRADASENDWVLVGYDSPKAKALKLISSGTGSLDQLLNHLENDTINYGLLRVSEKIDNSVTVKFVFIQWQPESVPTIMRATVSTHKGDVRQLFGQWHVDFFITTKEEINMDLIKQKVGDASGGRNRVQ